MRWPGPAPSSSPCSCCWSASWRAPSWRATGCAMTEAATPFPVATTAMNDASPAYAAPHRTPAAAAAPKLAARGLDFWYGDDRAGQHIALDIPERQVTALIGPSGCGTSTLLRVFNRIYALYPGQRATGQALLDGENILDPKYPLNRLRSK